MRNLVVAVALVLIACGSDGAPKASGGGGATSSGGTGATGGTSSQGSGGSGSPGSEGKTCYPNGTCNASLTCLSNLCVNAGAAAGGSAAGGATPCAGGCTNGDGGASGSGGQRAGGATSAGGKSGNGGAGTGGANGNGASSGSGGSSTFCYPVDPTHTDATFTACASGLGCYPTPTGDTHCAGPTTASGTEGVDCFALSGQPDNTQCALGYFCGSGLTCQKYCRVSTPFCPSSELCEIFPSRALLAGPEEIGFCQ